MKIRLFGCVVWLILLGSTPLRAAPAISIPSSRFEGMMDRVSYPPAPPPAAPTDLKWTLSATDPFGYDYHHQLEASYQMGKEQARQQMQADGTLLILTKDGDSGILLCDVHAKVKEELKGAKTQEAENDPSPLALGGLKEDGHFAQGESSWATMFSLVFPLPSRPLAVGEEADAAVRMPVTVLGSPVFVSGQAHISLTGYVKVEGRVCARLQAVIYLDQVDLPTDMAANYKVQVRGRSVAYFDAARGAFRSGELALSTSVRLQMASPAAIAPPGPKARLQRPPTTQYVTDSDNFISFKENDGKRRTPHE